ncbi:MAG TPA: DUF4394 domain-containing protein [Chthoniobacteraceae bacterium]|nr:DUF4394 domain-containing protein [Chthoniobacteraceae bacterium]
MKPTATFPATRLFSRFRTAIAALLHRRAVPPALALLALLGATATATAQKIYVANSSYYRTIGTYDTLTGAEVNRSFLGFIDGGEAMALRGNTLYYVGYTNGANRVLKFSASGGSGGAWTWIEDANSNNVYRGLAVAGNTLYVSQTGFNRVSTFDATTGATLNLNFIPSVEDPHGLAVAGGRLYVACGSANLVKVFDAATGSLMITLSSQSNPSSVAVRNNVLYIACAGSGKVSTFNASTGQLLNPALLSCPGTMGQIAIYGDVLYIAHYNVHPNNANDNAVGAFNAITGAEINRNLVANLSMPHGLAVGFGASIVSAPTSAAITSTSAVLGGSIDAVAAGAVHERGVVYSATNQDPDPGEADTVQVVEGGTATGVFYTGVGGLRPNTVYYFKAYAIDDAGPNVTTVGTFTTGTGAAPRGITVILPTATTPGTLTIHGDIAFATTSNSVRGFALDEWVADDGTLSTLGLGLSLHATLNGAPLELPSPSLVDNQFGSLGALTENDGSVVAAQAVPVQLGDALVIKAGAYAIPPGGTAGFNPQAQQTFTGKVFLLDGNLQSASDPIYLTPGGVAILGNKRLVANGGPKAPAVADGTDFGAGALGNAVAEHTFLILDSGADPLTLTGTPKVAISGANAADFTVVADPVSPVAAGGATTFAIRFNPGAPGLRTATVNVVNSGSGDYLFAIQGFGSVFPGVAVGLILGQPNTLLHFNPAGLTQPQQTPKVPISGLVPGEQIVALDKRPANGALLAFGVDSARNTATLYTLDPATGRATPVGTPGNVAFVDAVGRPVYLPSFPGTLYDMDVDPVHDQVRVVAGALNFRLEAATGLPVDGDAGLASDTVPGVNPDGAIDGTDGNLVGAAYTNPVAGATATTLYTLTPGSVTRNGALYRQTPPNSGANTDGKTLVFFGYQASGFQVFGLDIPSNVTVASSDAPAAAGYGYLCAPHPQASESRVFRVNLATGEISFTAELNERVFSLALLSTPAEPPAVTAPTLADVTAQSASLGGTVADNGSEIIDRGIVITRTSDSADPIAPGAPTNSWGWFGTTGAFAVPVTGLAEQTQYSFRAYAQNALGTSYSDIVTFTTRKLIDFNGANDSAITARGQTRIYPLANDVSPSGAPLHLVAVSDPAIVIDGTSLVIPAGYTGTFTYNFSDGTQTGQASVTVTGVQPGTQVQYYSGLLRNATGAIAGYADVTYTATGRAATVVLKVGSSVARTVVVPIAGSAVATHRTTLGIVTVTANQDGTVTAQLAAPNSPLSGILSVRHAPVARARYHVALAGVDAGIPGGGYAIVTVLPNAGVIITSVLPDGSALSAAASLRENSTIALFSSVGGVNPRALAGGELVLADLAATDLTGEWAWMKPKQKAGVRGLHLGGVDTLLTANGSRYDGHLPVNGSGRLTLSGGDLPDESHFLTIANGRPAVPAGSLKSWFAYPKTGTFLAGLKVTNRPGSVLARGVYLPKSNTAWGCFPGVSVGGRVVLSTQ